MGILVDVDVPWFPSDVQTARKIVLGAYRHRHAQARLADVDVPRQSAHAGRLGRILEQVLEDLKAKATPRFKEAAAERMEHIKALRQERIDRAAKLAADKGKPGAINPHYLMAELGKVLDDDAIIFNEGVTNAGAVLMQIPRQRPNTTMRSGGGGLGWSGGMALGAKLAAPDRLMVQISGDGGFYFGNPSSVFAVSQQYKLPFFSIVMDNTGWNAVKQSTLRVYPEGEAKGTANSSRSSRRKVRFTKVAEAFGAYGEEVSDPADVPAAIARCLKEVRGGRAALLHARVTKI